MSMTAQQVIDDVRPLVNDVSKTTWSDTQFLIYLNEGLRWIFNNQPECRLQSDGTNTTHTAATIGTTLWLADLYREALVEYLAYRYFDSDGSDTRDQNRAEEHLAKFMAFFKPAA